MREQALQLSEHRFATSAALRSAALAKAVDPAVRVRFQAAFTLGAISDPNAVAALATILVHDGADPWVQTAALSSAA